MVKDWSSLQEDIKKLYHTENQPLKEVMRIVKGRHGFHASERSYRTQLQKWGYLKYSTESHPKPISRAQKVRSKRRSNVRSTNQIPPASSSDGVSRSATFQPNLPSFSILGHDATDGLYYNTGPAIPFHSSDGPYLGINASIPLGSTHVPLHYGFGLDEQDSNGKTQLHRATIDKSLDQVKAILFAGSPVDIKDHSGYQPLHYAAMADDLEIFKLLLQFGADINAKGQLGRSPIHLAISNKQMIDLLRQKGASISKQDDRGDTALHLALTNSPINLGSDSVIDALLPYTPDMNLANKTGFTPFHRFLDQEYDADTLKYLARVLDLGADINYALPDGRLPAQVFLARAEFLPRRLKSSMNDVLERFLARGADPLTSFPNGVSIFIRLVENQFRRPGTFDEGLTLLSNICNSMKTGPINEDGNSALHELFLRCHFSWRTMDEAEQLVSTILTRGGDPNLQNRKGETPLLLLLTMKGISPSPEISMVKMMQKLLSFGADPLLQDLSGKCALYEAAEIFSSKDIIDPFLIAASERKEPWPHLQHQTADERAWWEHWNLAMQADYWTEIKTLPAPCDRKWPEMRANRLLVEKHLEKATKMSVEGDLDKQETHRKYVAGILRDCRSQNIDLDLKKWFDYLLKLC